MRSICSVRWGRCGVGKDDDADEPSIESREDDREDFRVDCDSEFDDDDDDDDMMSMSSLKLSKDMHIADFVGHVLLNDFVIDRR
jgi:hypothetical protein